VASVGDIVTTVEVNDTAIVVVRNTTSAANTTTTTLFSGYLTTALMATQLSTITGITATANVNVPCRYLHKTGPIDVTQAPAQLSVPASRVGSWRIDLPRGIVKMIGTWRDRWSDGEDWIAFGCEPQSVFVDYNAGFATIPYDIEATAIELSALMFKGRKRDETLNSESLGDYSYVSGGASRMTEIMEERLGGWKVSR
jgi:hypothetical protein